MSDSFCHEAFLALYEELMCREGLVEFAAPNPYGEKFSALTQCLLRGQEQMNLTAITEIPDIIVKHYADCVRIQSHIPKGAKLLDVGCGGGFPTLPLAIVRPDLSITALDSTAKKLRYVASAAETLGLSGVTTLPARAEEEARGKRRESFDVVTARAVARLNLLCEWCLPLLKVGGIFLSMKGASGQEELREAENAIQLLGGQLEEFSDFTVGGMSRTLIRIRKVTPTPEKYPRSGGKIKKSPL